MNYEEKYKSALEWMRSIYPTMQEADKEDAEHYFPELRESEDERIRKEILYAIRQLDDKTTIYGINYDYQKWIAWLEKQGEQSSWSEEDEGQLQNAIDALEFLGKRKEYYSQSGYDAALSAANWLKSLKPNHCKPSEELLKDLPKWKKATEHKDLEKHIAILEDGKVLLSDYLEECDYYIELDDLKTLPKEE